MLNTSNSGTPVNSGGSLRSCELDPHAIIESSENATFRFRDFIPSSPPRPASRMSWCSTTTTSSEKTIMATSPLWVSNSPRNHRRSQSSGNGQSRISFESCESSGTFGLGRKDSSHSVLDHDSIAEVSEEDLEGEGGDEDGMQNNEQGELDSSTPTVVPSESLPVTVIDTPSLGRAPMKQLVPVQAVVAEAEQGTNEATDAHISSFEFPSFPPNSNIQMALSIPASYPHIRTAISAPAAPAYSACNPTILSSRHRVFSLPTSMPITSPTETGILSQVVERDLSTDSLAPPRHLTRSDARPHRIPRKSTSPSILSITPTSNPNIISSSRTICPPHQSHGSPLLADNRPRELVRCRESSATVETADTSDTTTSTGTVTSKRLRFRKSIGSLFNRLFLERRTPPGGVNTP